MNVQMPFELASVGVQRAENADLNGLFARMLSMVRMAKRKRSLSITEGRP